MGLGLPRGRADGRPRPVLAAPRARAELVTARLPRARSSPSPAAPRVASARAGNVIGGGDWARGPAGPRRDARALARRGASLRPQPRRDPALAARAQPAGGYLRAGRRRSGTTPSLARRAGTSGPADEDARPVGWIVERLCRAVARASSRWTLDDGPHPHEARYLKLDSCRARSAARLAPRWALRPGAREHRRLVPRAARRRGRCARRDARADPRATATRPHATVTRPAASAARRSSDVVRRPRHVAAGQLLPAARRTLGRDGALLSAARARLRQLLPRAARGVRDARATSSRDYAYFSSYSDSWLEHAAATPRR